VDLITWYLAQLDEDEAVARAATDGHWYAKEARYAPKYGEGVNADVCVEGATDGYTVVVGEPEGFGACALEDAVHIARHDPAHVLADIAAKWAIVEIHGREHWCPNHLEWDEGPCQTLRLLASALSDRPGYDPAWAPS